MQVQALVIRPALEAIKLWSPGAEALLLGTAAQESQFTYLHQLGKGPAVGLFQMEPATYADHMHWLETTPSKHALWVNLMTLASRGQGGRPDPFELSWNLRFAAALCRIHYYRTPCIVPDPADVNGLAKVWKQYYNTPAGAGTEKQFVRNFGLYVRK